jgi:hypothetical protein
MLLIAHDDAVENVPAIETREGVIPMHKRAVNVVVESRSARSRRLGLSDDLQA